MQVKPLEVVDRSVSDQWIYLSETLSSKMKSCIVLVVLSVAVMALARPEEARYTDRYDNVNLDEILSNRRLLVPYVKCILDQGKCAPDGKELKEHIKEALDNGCGKCTETQKSGTSRVISHLINHEDAYWNELIVKYDPQRKYTAKYEKELKEIKQ